jgi:hypothetical protein
MILVAALSASGWRALQFESISCSPELGQSFLEEML